MEIVRFYALDPGPEMLAKYSIDKDLGLEGLQKLCAPVLATAAVGEDIYDVLNVRINELDQRLAKAGFQRLPLLDSVDWDEECTRSYDICFNPQESSTTYIVWKIEPVTDDEDYTYRKAMESKIVVGALVH